MLRQMDVQLEMAQNQRRTDAGNQNGGEQCRNDDIEQVISRVNGGDADDERDSDINEAGARDLVVHGIAHTGSDYTSRQVWYGRQSNHGS